MWSEHEPEKTRPGHHASALARRLEFVTSPCMVAERLVAILRSLHGWWTLLPKQSRREQPLDEAADQSAKEILRGSLVEQVAPAEYDVAETTELTPNRSQASPAERALKSR